MNVLMEGEVMLNDYKLKGSLKKVEIEIEAEVAENLAKMSKFRQLSASEITNTALKRFISHHKDFFPEVQSQKK